MKEKDKAYEMDNIDINKDNYNYERKLKLRLKWDYIYYIFYVLFGFYLRNKEFTFNIEVGDLGKLAPAMFISLSIVAIKWMIYLGIGGLILTTRKEKLKDIISLYFVFSLIVLSISLIPLFII